MNEVMKPTVGRIVLFRYSESQIFPAIVTNVHEKSGMINVQVFTDTHVEAFAPIQQGEGIGQWDWMPFQKDQQKRVEAMAEAKVEEMTGGASVCTTCK